MAEASDRSLAQLSVSIEDMASAEDEGDDADKDDDAADVSGLDDDARVCIARSGEGRIWLAGEVVKAVIWVRPRDVRRIVKDARWRQVLEADWNISS